MPKLSLGQRLRQLRYHRGLTVSQLGQLADCSMGLISKIENDIQKGCQSNYISRYCKVLGCSADWLIDGVGINPITGTGVRPGWVSPVAVLGPQIDGRVVVQPLYHQESHHYVLVTSTEYPIRLGDAIVIDTEDPIQHGCDLVTVNNGQATYYRLLACNNNMLQLENVVTREREMRQRSEFELVGQVVGSVVASKIQYINEAAV